MGTKIMRKILTTALLLCSLYAQAQIQTDSVRVYYRVGKSLLEPAFHGNDTVLAGFVQRLRRVTEDPRNRNFNFRIKSYASLEGPLSINRRLYAGRTDAFMGYLREEGIALPGRTGLWQDGCYNWEELRRRVEDSDMPYKKEVLDILHHVPEWGHDSTGKTVELRKGQLMALAGGVPFRYMLRHFFPEMRYSSMLLFYETVDPGLKQRIPLPEVTSTGLPGHLTPMEGHYPAPRAEEPSKKPFYMAVKTNLIYDAALVPNIGVEFYLKNDWSLSAGWMYGWWKKDRIHWYWRAYGGDIAMRRWLGKAAQEKPLTGHHLGVYAQVLTYDFEAGGRGYMGGEPGGTLFDRANFAGGVEYGYSLPVARRLNMDFSIGIGYLGGKYYEYLPIDDCYVWQVTKQRHYFGPTKLEVSLVWLLGRDNINKGKGGKR